MRRRRDAPSPAPDGGAPPSLRFDIARSGGEKQRMELSDLTREERVALAALLEFAVESNPAASDDERDEMQRIVAAVGEAAYTEAADEAGTRFRDEADLKAFLPRITRPEARELIYGTVLEAALPDAVSPHESAILDWLAKAWGVTVRIEDQQRDS